MPHSQYTFSSGARMCLSLIVIAALAGATAGYLFLGWLCLHIGTLASHTAYPEKMGFTLATITFFLAYSALVLWVSQCSNAVRLAISMINKAHAAIHQRSLPSAAV